MMIIGLTGLFGAGKGEVAKILKERGFVQYVMSDILRKECKRRGLEENRDNLLAVGNDLRKRFGSGILIKKIIELSKEDKNEDIVIDGLRSIGESEELKRNNGFLIVVQAPIEVRYERIRKRGSSKDNISFEMFKKQEEREMSKPGAQLDKCIVAADYKIINDSTKEDLKRKIDSLFKEIRNVIGV